jgi:hypothetical protein
VSDNHDNDEEKAKKISQARAAASLRADKVPLGRECAARGGSRGGKSGSGAVAGLHGSGRLRPFLFSVKNIFSESVIRRIARLNFPY